MQQAASTTVSPISVTPVLRPTTTPQGGVRSVALFGTQVNIFLTGEDTNGVYSTYEVICEPGAGSPPHVHSWDDESFHVVEGEFEIMRGDELFTAGPGTTVALPRHIPHYFRNVGTGTGRLLGMATPAGHEHFFVDASQLSFPPDPEAAAAVCRKHGLELVAPGK